MILLIMYKHHVECWTHWLWIWLTVGRAPGVKAGSRAALLPGVGILYIYIYMIYICHIFNIWKYRIHSSYLHISTCLWFKKMIIWMRIYTSIWCARSADGFTTLFSWMQHVQALELVIPSVAQCLCVLQGYQDISSFGHVFLTPTFWCWFVK